MFPSDALARAPDRGGPRDLWNLFGISPVTEASDLRAADPIGTPPKTYPPDRWCSCLTRLSIYNPGPECYTHTPRVPRPPRTPRKALR